MSEAGNRVPEDTEPVCRSPPSFEQRIYSPHSIAAIVAELDKQGVPASTALEGTRLTLPQLEIHTTRVSYRQLDIVIRNALRLSDDPAIGLHAGKRMHITAYGMYGYALLSSATHAEARDFSARYIRVVGPFCNFVVSHDAMTVKVTLEPMHWPSPRKAVHRFAVEFALSAHLTATRDRVGQTFRFSLVSLDYPAPPHADVYNSWFECPVKFEQANCGFEHDRVEGSLTLADPRTHAMAREMCEQLLSEINRAGGNAWRAYEWVSGRRAGEVDPRFGGALAAPPPVPTTAIFSRTDGICAWQGCMEKPSAQTESIEVESSHCGMGHHPAVVYAIADRLAQAEGEWQPFNRSSWRSLVYPDPHR